MHEGNGMAAVIVSILPGILFDNRPINQFQAG
jgi:hypothetical protein